MDLNFFVHKKMTKAEMQVKRVSELTEERAVFEAKTKAEAEAYTLRCRQILRSSQRSEADARNKRPNN